MKYIHVGEIADKWGLSERSVRNYCVQGRVIGAFLQGKTWMIPENAERPGRKKRQGKVKTGLVERLKEEKESAIPGGIYHKVQIELTYNSNHIEGSMLSHDQTRMIFETNTIGIRNEDVSVDDIVEAANHFRCIDLMIDQTMYKLSESFIKQMHRILKSGTSDSRKAWFNVGEYKRFENEVGNRETTPPDRVAAEMKILLQEYNKKKNHTLDEIIEFHYRFERIHPFQDGNGRVGRLIMFKECMRSGIIPFIIQDRNKAFYYRGLQEWKSEPGYLRDTCLAAQDEFRGYMTYYGLKVKDVLR